MLGDVNGTQFGSQRAAKSPGHHHGRQYRADLLDHREVDDRSQSRFLANGFELGVAFDGQHHADESAGDGDDRDGLGADVVHLRKNLLEVFPAPESGSDAAEGTADEDPEVAEGGHDVGGGAADLLDEGYGHGRES